ncbi:MAG: hypothetical protein P1V51_21855 [Deltaproteobacteria bacterium]|nr:hypothetical protein [Deltaproteobacteria bacterium]
MLRPAAPLSSLALLALAASSAACGQGPLGAYLDVAFERSGDPTYAVTLASAVVIDADKAPAWMGLDRAGISAVAAPAVDAALEVCRVETGVASDVAVLRLMDPGPAYLGGPAGEQALTATAPAFGEGTGYTARFESGEIDYQPGGGYQLRTDGMEAPPFSVNLIAPAEFSMETLGFVTPGPGTAVLPSTTDLDLTWAPASTDPEDELFVVLSAAESRVVCRAKDDGAFTIKAKYLEELPLGAATLMIERSRLVKLDVGTSSAGKIPARGRIALRHRFAAELQ